MKKSLALALLASSFAALPTQAIASPAEIAAPQTEGRLLPVRPWQKPTTTTARLLPVRPWQKPAAPTA